MNGSGAPGKPGEAVGDFILTEHRGIRNPPGMRLLDKISWASGQGGRLDTRLRPFVRYFKPVVIPASSPGLAIHVPVAQGIERLPSKQRVVGSNPTWGTIFFSCAYITGIILVLTIPRLATALRAKISFQADAWFRISVTGASQPENG